MMVINIKILKYYAGEGKILKFPVGKVVPFSASVLI